MRSPPVLACAPFALLLACSGVIAPAGSSGSGEPSSPRAGGSGGGLGAGGAIANVPAPPAPRCAPPAHKTAGPTLRRLTRSEYDHTVADLLGDRSSPAASFPPDQILLGFDNNADAAPASTLFVEQAEAAAERLATNATADASKLMGCDPAAEACVRTFVTSFGLRAFRRPLSDEERDRFLAFYAGAKTKYGASAAVRMVVQAMLQSPFFLYRVDGPELPANPSPATGYELASRLSYLLWSTMPDDELFAAAKAGTLGKPDGLLAQARRMLTDDRARQGLLGFFDQWLGLTRVETAQKDPQTYPSWSAAIGKAMRQESESFVAGVVLRGDGTLRSLLAAPQSYLDRSLASFYGVAAPAGGDFVRVDLDPKRRAGLLTQGAFLAAAAAPRRSSPVARGFYVLDRLLCAPPPPPPANVNTSFPDPVSGVSTRERLAAHRTNPTCAGCHGLMDPIGLGFEHYDGVAQWRDVDGDKPVDATGTVGGTADANGPFDGAIELANRLAGSAQVRECVARKAFRYAYARAETDDDACTIQTLAAALDGDAGSVLRLMLALVASDPFVTRNPAGGAP